MAFPDNSINQRHPIIPVHTVCPIILPDMVGCQKYTDEQITFVLNRYARGVSRPEISKLYAERFDRPDYTHKKVQYVIDQFGKHPKYRYVVSPAQAPTELWPQLARAA